MPALASYFKSFLLSIILFCFLTTIIYANVKTPEHTRETCQKLMDDAKEDTNNNNYAQALEKLLTAELMAKENAWADKLWQIKNSIGVIYSNISNFGEALSNYRESLDIIQNNPNLNENKAVTLLNIGVLYVSENKTNDALYYMQKANEAFDEFGGSKGLKKNIVNNLAYIYNDLGKPKKSLQVLNEVKDPIGDTKLDFLWKAIYIRALLLDGQIEKSQALAENLYKNSVIQPDEYPHEECYTCLALVLSQIYTAKNEYDTAISFLKSALKTTDDLTDKIDFYEDISTLYLQKNDFQSAFLYKDSTLWATNQLSSRINRNLFEINKVKLKVGEYQNELALKKKQQRTERIIFILLLILALIFLFLIYKTLKIRADKQKQKTVIANLELEKKQNEYLLAENELEMVRLKQERLKLEIAQKNRELSAKTIYLTNRNDLIKEIISSLENSNKIVRSNETAKQIQTIKTFLKTDSHQEDFIKHFENVNPDFLKQLKLKHPKLSTNDIRFLCYIYMNLTLKEISTIFNVTYDACRVRRNRIMEKMGMDKNKNSLYDYLMEIIR